MKVCPQCQLEYAEDVDFCPSDGTKLRKRRDDVDDPLIGRALDNRWVIEEKLGEGGMGAVYRGHQKSVSRTVAIKTLRPQLVDSDEFVDRFFREAKIAAMMSHPNSVTILDYGESEDGTLYLAMEFLEGELLTDRIDAGTLSIKQILEIGIQVASALSAAHDNQIVHRDLKPDNIFLLDVPGGSTFVKVLDFGIAKMLDSKTQVTKTGMIFGTPEYMSPEQCRGDKIDGRADLYSLGCIMYELAGGRTPFRATTPMAVLMAHVNQAAPALAPEGTAAHVPQEVERVIMRLLEKNPDHRFASAGELRETLEAVLQALDNPNSTVSRELVKPVPSREIVAPQVNIGFDATMGMAETGPASALETEERREQTNTDSLAPPTSSRGPIAVLVVLLFCLAAAGVALAAVWQNQNAEPVAEVDEPPASPTEVTPPPAPAEPTAAAAVDEPDGSPDDGEEAEVAAVTAAEEPTAKVSDEPRRPKKRAARPDPPDEPKVEPKPEPKPRAETPPPDPKPKPPPKKKKKPKRIKEVEKEINKKAEDARDDVKKGVEKTLDNVMDGLMN